METERVMGSSILQKTIKHWAQEQGDKPCIIETGSGTSLTYSQLIPAMVRAERRWERAGGSTTMLVLSGGITDAVLWLAALTSGRQLVPVSPSLTEHEYSQLRAYHQPDEIISEVDSQALQGSIPLEQVAHDIFAPTPDLDIQLTPAREGSAIFATSGSTGAPKRVLLTATHIVAAARHIQASHQLTNKDRCLTPLPFSHVNAPVVSLITSIISGGTVIIAPRYSTSQFWSWVDTYQPTWISIVPTIIAMALTTERPAASTLASVRFVRTASAPLPRSDLQRFEAKFGIPVIETYGLSEAASTIAANPIPPGVHKPGSVGQPIGIEMRVCDSAGLPLAVGAVGEVQVRGQNIITSYLNGAGEASFHDNWLRTGDMGYFDDEGYLYLTGRLKDIIIRGGENIMPRELEETLLECPVLREITIVGQPDPIYGERVVAFVVLHERAPGGLAALQAHAAKHLSRGRQPELWRVVTELPRTASGKIDKVRLRAELAQLSTAPALELVGH